MKREYLFVVDVSGSMHGFPLDTARALMRDLLAGLKPTETFNILFFSGGADLLSSNPLPATPENCHRRLSGRYWLPQTLLARPVERVDVVVPTA